MNYISQLLKRCIYLFVLIVCNKVTKIVIVQFKRYGNYFYSCFIKTSLKKLDDGFLLEYPVILKGGKYIEIGKNFSSRSRLRIEAWDVFIGTHYCPRIIIGNNVIINFDCHIGAINLIQIGDNVLIGSRVLITDHSHGEISTQYLSEPPSKRPLYSKGAVIIEDNVWIGEGVVILANVRIGRNSIIGANSVVNKNIPANCVIGGIPSKIIKQL